jgi:hypothetical protein
MKRIIAMIYEWHIMTPHNADFEVCHSPLCRLARWYELFAQNGGAK